MNTLNLLDQLNLLPDHNTAMADWLLQREKYSRVRQVSRHIEMIADSLMDTANVIQFCDDVELYGMYQAVLMCQDNVQSRMINQILAQARLKKLPVHSWHELPKNGKVIEKQKTTHTPESVWRLNEAFLQHTQVTVKVTEILKKELPVHISEHHIKLANERGIFYSVMQVPYQYMCEVCSKLNKLLDVPLPPEPKCGMKHFPQGVPAKLPTERIFVIDKSGNAWTWNMGWYRIDVDGNRLNKKPALGHATFQKHIKLASEEELGRTSFRHTRPWGMWRRGSGPVSHPLYGNGIMTITDGAHAVVKFNDGIKREVVLNNLRSIGERAYSKSATKVERVKVERVSKIQLNLEQLKAML